MKVISSNSDLGNVLLLICEGEATIFYLDNMLINPFCDSIERFQTEQEARDWAQQNQIPIQENLDNV